MCEQARSQAHCLAGGRVMGKLFKPKECTVGRSGSACSQAPQIHARIGGPHPSITAGPSTHSLPNCLVPADPAHLQARRLQPNVLVVGAHLAALHHQLTRLGGEKGSAKQYSGVWVDAGHRQHSSNRGNRR